jgi:ketosteroid isomerase-like protein
VRWRQQSQSADGRPISDLASAVYRVADGRIAEYWIQIDRAGAAAQR